MAKQYKIKRSRQYGSGSSYRAGPHPVTVVLTVIALVALLFVGISLYQPFMNFLTSDHSAGEVSIPEAEPSAVAPEEADPEPEPEPEPTMSAEELRSIYLPTQAARDPAGLAAFLEGLEGTDINAVMVDLKNDEGQVLFTTTNARAGEWGAQAPDATDLAALADTLRQSGYALVVRMSAFHDPLAARAARELAVTFSDSDWLWLDADENPWLNPYSADARAYLIDLADEAAQAGAVMVVLSEMQFPYNSGTNANFGPDAASVTRTEALSVFMDELGERLADTGARAGVYVTAAMINNDIQNPTRYGGSPLDIRFDTLVLGAMPHQFSGDYNLGGLVVNAPIANPGGVTESIMAWIADMYAQRGGEPPRVMPMIQGGNEERNADSPYTNAQVDAQLDALRAAGSEEYILYQSAGDYLLG